MAQNELMKLLNAHEWRNVEFKADLVTAQVGEGATDLVTDQVETVPGRLVSD